MDRAITTGWSLAGVVTDGGEIIVNGINPWQHKWTRAIGRIWIAHPSHPEQRHLLDVWQIEHSGSRITFAAGELSNGVWCFFKLD